MNAVVALHQEITDTLIGEILLSRYHPGDRLPSERELAARFEVNRGAAREAIKKLEQIGLVIVQPGGARVQRLEEASLDVIGYLLRLQKIPDVALVDEVMEVMECLSDLAVARSMASADSALIIRLKCCTDVLLDLQADPAAQLLARIELGREFMLSSGSLPLKLISNALQQQFFEQILTVTASAGRDGAYARPHIQALREALDKESASEVVAAYHALFAATRIALMDTLHKLSSPETGPAADIKEALTP